MFEVKKHLIKVQGNRLYLPVAARLVWFRQEHPDWGIETRPIVIDMEKQYAIFEAKVFNAEGKLMAQGTKMENVRGFPDFIEKAETGSIGRALAVCGFGTQFAPDLDEVPSGRVVDAPQPARSSGAQNGPERGRNFSYSNGTINARNGQASGNDAPRTTGLSDGLPPGAFTQRPASNGTSDDCVPHNGAQDRSSGAPAHAAGEEASNSEKPSPGELECTVCKRSLTKGQELLSVRKFGVALCPECQKERRSVEAIAGKP